IEQHQIIGKIGGEDCDPVAACDAELRFERTRGSDDAGGELRIGEVAALESQRDLLRREVGVADDQVGEVHDARSVGWAKAEQSEAVPTTVYQQTIIVGGHAVATLRLSPPYGCFPARQPISQKSASSRVASLNISTSSALRAGVA